MSFRIAGIGSSFSFFGQRIGLGFRGRVLSKIGAKKRSGLERCWA